MSTAGSSNATAAGNASTAAGTAAGKQEKPKKHYAGQEKCIASAMSYDFGAKKDGGKGAKVAITFLLESGSHTGEIHSWFGVLNEENDDQFNRCIDALVHCGASDSLDLDGEGKLIGFGGKKPILTMGDTKDPKGNVVYGVVFVNGGTPMANALSSGETKSLLGGLAGKLADRKAARAFGRGSSGTGGDEVLRDDEGNEIPI